MVTLIEQMTKEITSSVPDATPDMVSQYLINVIEQEVLPVSFENAHFPKQLSRVESVKKRFLAKRAKVRVRRKYQSQIQKSEVVKEFEDIRNYFRSIVNSDNTMGWRKFDVSDNSTGFRNISAIGATYPFTNFVFGDGISQVKTIREVQSSKELQQVVPYNVFSNKEKAISFIFDRPIYDLISSDYNFSKRVGIIESASRLFVLSKDLQASMMLSLRKDIETPKLEKFILTMNLPKLDFDKKMDLWDDFDHFVRQQIQEKIRHSNAEEKEKLQDFNERLFTNFPLED
jgi:hypothetical protein